MPNPNVPAAPLVHLSSDFIRAKEYLEAIVSSTSDAICTTDVRGRVIYFSPGASQMTCYSSAELVGRPAHQLYAGGRAEADRMMRLLRRQGSLKNHETALKGKDGRKVHVSMSVALLKDRAGRVIGTLGISKDISSRVELERRLRELSITDNLTGLYNQRHFHERLVQEVSRARRQRGRLSMILIDLDGFKAVNDTRGHLEGDRILRAFAMVLNKSIRREVDAVFRYGGDEFVILLPGLGPSRAQRAAERILAGAHTNVTEEDIRFSYGVASLPASGSVKEFIAMADKRMFRMKAGHNRRA
ncbi:MAG: GGDEF domain-containing protein [Elusimicrobia bacterium]|nr:GGDEF domain-containing protein [Elusimicrobiota bacterium]